MVNGSWLKGGDGDKVESSQGVLAHRLGRFAPAVQLKAGLTPWVTELLSNH